MSEEQILTPTLDTRRSAPVARLLIAILIASLAATTANVILYFILKDIFGIPTVAPEQFPPPELSPLPASDVILFSLIFSAGAGLVFLIVANTARRPAQVFVLICTVVLILSLFLPLRIPPPVPMSTKLSLLAMHILGAAVLMPLLIVLGLPSNEKVKVEL